MQCLFSPARDFGLSPPICGLQEGLLLYPAPSLELVHGRPKAGSINGVLRVLGSGAAPKLSWRNGECFPPVHPPRGPFLSALLLARSQDGLEFWVSAP